MHRLNLSVEIFFKAEGQNPLPRPVPTLLGMQPRARLACWAVREGSQSFHSCDFECVLPFPGLFFLQSRLVRFLSLNTFCESTEKDDSIELFGVV